MMKKNEENKGITFLFVIQSFSFILSVGGIFALLMIWSISCSTKQSGAYERYDAMEAELDELMLPEKTILDSTDKGVRSSWVYSSKSYRTNSPYDKLIPFYRQQLKLGGWSELGKKDDSDEKEDAITYSFKRQDWRLKLMTARGRKGKSTPYAPWSYAYTLTVEWEK